MRNIILADNQDISKFGWRYILEHQFDFSNTVEASGKAELLKMLIENPDSLIILDYTLFDFESVNDLIILQIRFEQADWILFSDELSDEFLRTLLFNTTTFSVLLKDSSTEEILTAFKEASKGGRFICNHVSNMLLDSSKANSNKPIKQKLTITEQEILKEMALGKSTKEIAAKRHVSVHTVMTHRKNIFRKIEVNNVHEATKYAMRAGIVDLAEYYI
ncbi:MAG: response regulator transcription factor [Paludibacter sp.]|nr:response regulator transcription factor [Paludibacter sp.]